MTDRPGFDRQQSMVAAFVELETATEYLRTVFEIVPLGVAIALDPECRDIRANHMLAEQLGMSAEENISKTRGDGAVLPYRVFADGVEISGNQLPLQRAMIERRTVEMEHTIRRADGSEIIIAASAMPLFDSNGELRGGVYASLDVTAQRRAEAAARQQEQALATVLERIADGVVIYDGQLRITYANRATCEVARRSLDELIGVDVSGAMGEDHEFYESSYRRVIESGEAEHFEAYSGQYGAWFDVDVYPHEGGVAVFFRDITSRHEAVEALRASEANARAIAADLNAIMDAVPALTFITHDRQARWMRTSRTGSELLRLSKSGMNASLSAGDSPPSFRAYRDGRELDPAELPVQIAAATGREVRSAGMTLKFPDGTAIDIFGNAVPLFDDDGSPRGAVGAFLDVTELEKARHAADAANAAKDAFLSALSHELRTPLTAIMGWSQTIPMLRDREELRQAAAAIEYAARAQARIIEDLMDVARISAGKLKFERERFRLDEVVASTLDLLRPQAEEKGVRIGSELEPIEIDGDKGRFQQVIWNLLANSIKFTPPGGTIAMCSRRAASDAELVVSDTGEGIDAAFIPSIFDAFAQERDSRQHGGLGLGLAIVKHIIEAHGGRISAASEGRGKGATFTVRLPASE